MNLQLVTAKPFPGHNLALSAISGVIIPVAEPLIVLSVLQWVTKGNIAIKYGHNVSCTQQVRYLNSATFSNGLLASEELGYLSQNRD